MELTIVIPCRNEEKRIKPTLEGWLRYFDEYKHDGIIKVVDGASKDGTAGVVNSIKDSRISLRLTHYNHGKGFCVREGMRYSQTAYAAYADADGATPPCELEKLIAADCDVAIGSRAVEGASVNGKGGDRKMASYLFNLACRKLATPGIYDTQCGFKLFRKEAVRDVFSKQRILGFAFDVEVLHIAMRLGYGIKEVGVEWHDREGSTVNLFRDSPKMFGDVVRVAWRSRKGEYKNGRVENTI